jgi:hypothetical protein
VSLFAERDDGVRRVEDRARRPVVPLELHDRRAGEARRELQDVPNRRRAERVDRLRVVADHHQPGAVGLQRGEDVGLKRVRVLVLVDEDVIEHGRDGWSGRRVLPERQPEHQEVVVVERVLPTLTLRVPLEDRPDATDLIEAPRVVVFEDVAQTFLRVDRAGVDVGERLLAREPTFPVAEPELAADQVHEVRGVGAVEHGEVRSEAEGSAVEAKQPVRRRVEGSAPDPAEPAVAGQPFRPREHLARGSTGEGEQQDSLGRDAPIDQARHAARKRPRLARTGAGDDQQRAAVVLDRVALLLVQAFKGVEHAFGHDMPRVRRAQAPTGLRADAGTIAACVEASNGSARATSPRPSRRSATPRCSSCGR